MIDKIKDNNDDFFVFNNNDNKIFNSISKRKLRKIFKTK